MHACRHSSNDEGVEWSHLAGYDEVKEQVQLCCASLAVQFALVMLRPSHSPALPHGCSAKRVRLCATEHGWYCESTHGRQTGVALYCSVQVEETVMLQLQHAEMFKKVPAGMRTAAIPALRLGCRYVLLDCGTDRSRHSSGHKHHKSAQSHAV
jgi:hypothetical protein